MPTDRHDALRSLYWRSRRTLPTGRPSWPGTGAQVPPRCSRHRGRLVAPGPLARPVRNGRNPTMAGSFGALHPSTGSPSALRAPGEPVDGALRDPRAAVSGTGHPYKNLHCVLYEALSPKGRKLLTAVAGVDSVENQWLKCLRHPRRFHAIPRPCANGAGAGTRGINDVPCRRVGPDVSRIRTANELGRPACFIPLGPEWMPGLKTRITARTGARGYGNRSRRD